MEVVSSGKKNWSRGKKKEDARGGLESWDEEFGSGLGHFVRLVEVSSGDVSMWGGGLRCAYAIHYSFIPVLD